MFETRYKFFVGCLIMLTIIPYELRGYFLWYNTILFSIYSTYNGTMSKHLFFTVLSGLIHSKIHVTFPFLDDVQGFNPNVSALPDVLFHTFMLIFTFLSIKQYLKPVIFKSTLFCIMGAVLNCVFTGFKIQGLNTQVSTETYSELLLNNTVYSIFVITTVFQALSTAYWIAFVIHYGEWKQEQFSYGLLMCITVIVSNWFWYHMDDIFSLNIGLVKLSMKFRYIEALFIVCTWFPLLFRAVKQCKN